MCFTLRKMVFTSITETLLRRLSAVRKLLFTTLPMIRRMKLETDIMVMTTPDLENFQLKHSYIKKDIEYIYVPHDINSSNLTFHKDALDHFDTIFASGRKNKEKIKERKEKFGLKNNNIVE